MTAGISFSSIARAEAGETVPLAHDEPQRLAYVHECGILDTPQEESFNRITRLVAMLNGMPMAGISVVDDHRQWLKSIYGPLSKEGPRHLSFCTHALLADDIFFVPDALEDARFCDNPAVTGPPNIRFYAGAPLISSVGYKLGALFVLDTRPHDVMEINRRILTDFAAIATDLIESRAKWL